MGWKVSKSYQGPSVGYAYSHRPSWARHLTLGLPHANSIILLQGQTYYPWNFFLRNMEGTKEKKLRGNPFNLIQPSHPSYYSSCVCKPFAKLLKQKKKKTENFGLYMQRITTVTYSHNSPPPPQQQIHSLGTYGSSTNNRGRIYYSPPFQPMQNHTLNFLINISFFTTSTMLF